jgi:hypothetical protein
MTRALEIHGNIDHPPASIDATAQNAPDEPARTYARDRRAGAERSTNST